MFIRYAKTPSKIPKLAPMVVMKKHYYSYGYFHLRKMVPTIIGVIAQVAYSQQTDMRQVRFRRLRVRLSR